jgi:glycosyltransferase involved in cell wall biosynthesis
MTSLMSDVTTVFGVSRVQPSIGVILPVLDGARFLGAAICSVIGQTIRPTEVIVVDDGSTDGSANIAARFGAPVTVLALPHQGGAAALNAGISRATAEYLAFIDADDLWAHDKLFRQLQAFSADADLEAVFGHVGEFRDMDDKIQDEHQARQGMRRREGINKTTMLIRKTAFERVGAFDPSFVAEFPEWYSRALTRKLRSVVLEDVLSFRRIHSANVSRTQRSLLHADYLRMARAKIRHDVKTESMVRGDSGAQRESNTCTTVAK